MRRLALVFSLLAAVGFALPAAIGAKLANPGEEVWVIAGDGGFQMTAAELTTCLQEGLKLHIAVINNGYLGMVRQWQELFYGKRYSKSYLQNPNYEDFAKAMGAAGMTVENKADVPKAIKQMLKEKKPCVVDFRVEPEENVWPMVPAGASINEMDGLDLLESMA